MAVLSLLLIATAVMQVMVVQEAVAQSGASGTSMECIEPYPQPDLPTGLVDDSYREMKCHLACIERVSRDEGVTIEVSTLYPAWPMIPDYVLERNCTIYQMVAECRRGCSGGKRCIRRCNSGCCEDCDTMESVCPYVCNKALCQIGCEVFDYLEIIKNQTDAVPPNPAAAIDLNIPKDSEVAGLYTMNPSDALPMTNEDNTTKRFPTGFVIIITQFEASYRTGLWMTSFDGVLNLEPWACDEVSITLVAVNKFGQTSNLAAAARIVDVYGESPPTSPTNPELYFEYEADTRPGYWKHAVVTISWDKPHKGFEVLLEYRVTFLLLDPEDQPNCEPRNRTFTLDKDATELTLRAESPLQGPVSDCKYTLKIMSVSTTNESSPPATVYDIHINSSMTVPVPLNFNCNRTWDEKSGTFGYKVNWAIPNDREVQRAIGLFNMTLDLVSPDGEIEQMNSTEFPFSANQNDTQYDYSQDVQHDNRPGYVHQITMTTVSGDYMWRVLVPAPRYCTFPAQAVPPAQVENIQLDKYLFEKVDPSRSTVDLHIEAGWNPASLGVVYYEIRLVQEQTYDEKTTGLLYSREPHFELTSVTFAASLPLPIQGPHIYFQVRAISLHNATGNWSRPVPIRLPEVLYPASSASQPSYTTQPTPVQGQSKAGSDGALSEVMYIIISVVVVLIVSISILALSICLAFFQTHKNGKNAKRLRANKVYLSRSVNEKDKYPAGKLDKWEIYSNQVAIQDRLGEGAFGDVYTGLFNSTISEKSEVKKFDANNSITVAIKLLREDAADKDRQIFLKHILQAKKVAQYPSPHVISLVGCITEQEPLSLLTEYPAQGNLLQYLRTQRKEIFQAQMQLLDYPDSVSGRPLPVVMPQYVSEQGLQAADLMLFISHVAAGLEHLASIGVVHGDVACRNLFLTADKVVKIADFGLDSTSDEEKDLIYVCSESGRLPIRWMAIESIRDSQFSTSSDVWAFGVTLWEIVTLGGFPYHDTANNDILATLGAGQRLECPSNCSEEIYGIMLKCCAATPSDRPSFSTLHHVFKSLHTTSNNGQYVTLDIDRTKSYYFASPRSSATESQTDEYTLLMEPVASNSVEAVGMQHTIPHAPGNYYTSHPPPVVPVQHARSASFNSYTYSDSGFLPCIEEEGEDESETEVNGDSEEKVKEVTEVEVDSGNDSTLSRESLKERKREEGEEAEGNVEVMGLL